MKHRGISLLLVLTFLLSVFMFCTTVFAAPATQDGITAELITDKEEYADGEPMEVSLKVQNINPRAGNIRAELILPNGILLNTGALVSGSLNLAPNQNAEIDYGLTAGVPSTTTTTTQATTAAPITTGSTTVPATTGSTTTVPATTVPATTGSTTTVPTTTVPTTTVPTTAASTTAAPTTAAGTTAAGTTAAGTVAPTTGAVTPGGPSDTGDAALYFFGALAIFSLIGLIIVFGGLKNLAKNRWFILILCCALLVGAAGTAVAYAAASDKTITVTKTVKVAGVDVVLKAEVTYDLLDDAVQTEQVEFKKDGQFLWNKDVEMGYWLPSDISYNGQTTSKDGSYRPEVTPPYIDMLFGCTSNQTGAFVSGEFTKNIFNAEADKTVLIGLTDDAASRAALELIDEDEWIITVIDGKLVVTGWYDNATVAAARALYALAAAETDNVTLTLPMIGKMDYVDVDLPDVTFGNFRGGMDSEQDVVVLRWNEVVADDFDTYCAALVEAGYTRYEYNTLDGFKQTKTLEFATYVKGEDAVIVQYLPISLLDEDPATLTADELKAQQAMFSPDGDSIRLILTKANRLTNNDAKNTGWEDLDIAPKMHAINIFNRAADGNAIGQGQLFTLADGSFILVDGGHQAEDAEQVYRAMKYLNERPDGKIVIAAWILTHDHRDHSGCIEDMSEKYASEITVEQIIMNNDPDTYMWRHKNAPYGYGYGTWGAFDKMELIADRFGENCQVLVAHMGQNIKIRNAEVEILTVGAEDLFPVLTRNDNSRSMAFRVSYPELENSGKAHSTLILGDVTLDNTYHTFFPLMTGELYADIVQVAHHGLGGQTSRFYPMFTDVDVALWSTDNKTMEAGGFIGGNNSFLQTFDPLNVVCDEYIMTFNLPFDKETDEVIRTKVGTFATELEELEMDITLLPAFRFQGKWNEKKDVIIDYLKEKTADVLILPLIDQNTTTKYNKADLVNELADALDYAYAYYAPVWGCETDADMQTGDGTMGHVILSVYPILRAETGILVEGTPSAAPEGRGYAHVLLDVEGLEVDFVATHFNDSGNWTKFAEIYQQWGKYTIIAGNTKIGGNTANASIDMAVAAFASDVTILATEGITFEEAATDSSLKTSTSEFFVDANMSDAYTVKAYIVQTMAAEPSTITFNANGGTGTMEAVTTRKALLDQPTCTFGAPDGKRFKGWAMSKADADAGTVIRRLVVTQDVELFAVWTDENNILISTAFSNFKDDNKTARNFFVDYYTQNVFDVIALNNISPTVDLDKLTEDIGFDYYYVAINSVGTELTVLISKFPISNTKSYEFNKLDGSNNKTSWDPMLFATMKVGDRYVDITIGQHHSMALRSFAANIVKENYDPTHELIITGYNSAAAATFFDATGVSLGFIKGSNNSLYYSAGLVSLGGGTDAGYTAPISSMWVPSYAEFAFVKTCQITLNANGGTGGPVSAPTSVPAGEFTPSKYIFLPPVGKTFAGWATTPNGTPTETFTITEDTTLYAIWESYNYPTYTAPSGSDQKETISAFQVWGIGTAYTTWEQYTDYISQEANHTDISILIHSVGDPAQLATLKEAAGYEYSYYVMADASSNTMHVLFSEYPINVIAAYSLPYPGAWQNLSTEGRAYAYLSLDVDGTAIDLVMGESNGNNYAGHWQNILIVEPWVESIADDRDNPLMIAGYKLNCSQDTSFRNFTKMGGGNSQYVLSASFTYSNYADLAKLSDHQHASAPAYVELTFATNDNAAEDANTKSLKVMSWNANLFGVSNACADAVINEIKAQNPDIVGLINIGNQQWRSTNTTYTLEQILAKLDYPYYYYLPLSDAYAFTDNVNFYGHLILSKYPLTGKVSSNFQYVGNSYLGHCVADLGADKLDLYITREVYGDRISQLYDAIQASNTAGNDFILFAEGNVGSATTIAGKPVAGTTFDAGGNGGIAIFASAVNQIIGADDVWMQNKPATIANDTNGNLIISNIAMMKITLGKEYTVSFNANGGTGTMDAVVVEEGAYTLPECGFTAPEGKRFKGWATSKANADAGTVIGSLTVSADIELFASWVDASKVSIYSNDGGAVDTIISYCQQNEFDIVAITSMPISYGSETKLNELKAAMGFKNGLYIVNDKECNVLLTNFPLQKVAEAPCTGNAPVLLATATINGVPVDICVGRYNTIVNRGNVLSVLEENYDTKHELILTGYLDNTQAPAKDNGIPLTGVELKFHTTRYVQFWATLGVKCETPVRVTGNGQAGTMKMSIQPYTVKFNGNGAAGTMADATNQNGSFDLPTTTTFTAPEGKRFAGWALSAEGEVITSLNLSGDTTLYAIWEDAGYTVSFNANGGTGTMADVTNLQGVYTLPANGFTAPNGGKFLGWSLTKDGPVIDSLTLNSNVTLYARWQAVNLKVMSWNVNLFGVSDAMADAVVAEVKAQNPDIVGLHNVGNQSWRSSNTSYTLDEILEMMDYPYSYYMPLGASYVYTDDNFYGSLILSKYPLKNMTAAGDLLHGTNYVGHCVADLGAAQVDLYIARELKAANRGDLYNLIQSNTTAGNDFILFAAGGVAADATIAGKAVAVATYDSNIAVVASTVNQSVGTDGMQMVTKPAAISNNANANLIIGNEAVMNISLAKKHTISFDANGGTGTMEPIVKQEGTYTLPENGFAAPTGKRFMGWSLTADGEVLTSLDLTEGVTLYAQWGADTLKVMSWNVNLFGVSDAMADAVVAEVKAQNPDIVGLQNVGNQSWRSSNTSYTLDNILEKMGYPYSYYVPLSASYVYTDDNFYGMLILSKYPLTNKTAAGDLLHGTNYVGHCVADLGTAQVDLYIARELKAANRGDLYNLIQSNTTAGNDFILFAAGGVAADATIAGKSVAVATYDSNIAVVASTVNQSVGTDDMQKVTKPAAISENTNGNAIIGNEALMTITIN